MLLYKRNVTNGSLSGIISVCKYDIYFCDVLILKIDDVKRKSGEWFIVVDGLVSFGVVPGSVYKSGSVFTKKASDNY